LPLVSEGPWAATLPGYREEISAVGVVEYVKGGVPEHRFEEMSVRNCWALLLQNW
jgi:hypothetical protein